MIPASCDLSLTPFHPNLLSPLVTTADRNCVEVLTSRRRRLENLFQCAASRRRDLTENSWFFLTG